MASINVFKTELQVAKEICSFVEMKANEALARGTDFTVGFSGGSLQKYLCEHLPRISTDWSKWRIFFCDERLVSFEDNDSTYKYYRDNLIGKAPIHTENIFPINPNLSVEECAKDYTACLRKVFPGDDLPRFDLLLLGIGPDGHTCSLFPSHPLLEEKDVLIAPISDSPKPPPCRVTMTYPLINNARCCAFVSCGAGKAAILKTILAEQHEPLLPAARVNPTDGKVFWFLDDAAASMLKNSELFD
ncbi:PREDICTED: 6-phosphogluconolactonase-like [Priapulus caudatus]|uniref:6-phosphogluconolactonase n=1 Tax=Priapulus caudatus TaxID=37621 RepID=A0ABM1FA19_PRICU|nr:PREDICTED: 6-phosphogluconolactonase-like [Priapulus caudatus]